MKKWVAFLLIAAMMLFMCACSTSNDAQNDASNNDKADTDKVDTTDAEKSDSGTESNAGNGSSEKGTWVKQQDGIEFYLPKELSAYTPNDQATGSGIHSNSYIWSEKNLSMDLTAIILSGSETAQDRFDYSYESYKNHFGDTLSYDYNSDGVYTLSGVDSDGNVYYYYGKVIYDALFLEVTFQYPKANSAACDGIVNTVISSIKFA